MKIRQSQTSVFSSLGPARSSGHASPSSPESAPFYLLNAVQQWEQGEKQEKNQVRWRPERLPLSVTVEEPPANVLLNREELHQSLSLALRQWELASQGYVTFALQENKRGNADIQVQWEQTPTFGRDYEVGHTDRQVRGGWIQQVSMTLVAQPVIERYLNPERKKQRLYSTLLHELGHALGLEHSEAKRDVMHHRGWRNLYLSDNDVRNLQALYSKRRSFVL